METRNRIIHREAAIIPLAILAPVIFAILLLGGCAGSSKSGAPKPGAASAVKLNEGGDLSELTKAAKTPEDAQILDLLLGYRMLLLRNPDPKALDKETLKKSRQAFDKLETTLRHGGIRSTDGGERIYSVTSEDRLSLQEVLRLVSEAANKDAQAGDWDKARARWKEIVQSKPAVTFAMEEAQWGLTLSDALQSKTVPDSIKKRLRDLDESYLAGIGHEEIGKQVKSILDDISDVKLERELKKLANRSWDRDKRAGLMTSVAIAQSLPPEASAPTEEAAVGSTGTAPAVNPTAAGPEPAAAIGPEAAAIGAQADTLVSQGKYVAALKALEKAGEQPWVKDKKAQIGNRFCEEKRKSAAASFKDFKKAVADSVKLAHLKRTASDLDSCIFYFPDLPVSQKVRKNREMVETELKKLKP